MSLSLILWIGGAVVALVAIAALAFRYRAKTQETLRAIYTKAVQASAEAETERRIAKEKEEALAADRKKVAVEESTVANQTFEDAIREASTSVEVKK